MTTEFCKCTDPVVRNGMTPNVDPFQICTHCGKEPKVWVNVKPDDKPEDLSVQISETEYPVEKPVFNLIHAISIERDKYKEHSRIWMVLFLFSVLIGLICLK